MKNRCFYTLLFLLLLTTDRLKAQPSAPAKLVPEFTFTQADGQVFGSADLPKGKLLLFVFVDPDCEHCQRAVRHMEEQRASFQKAAVYFISTASYDKINLFMASYAPRLKAQKNVQVLQDADSRFIVRFKPIRYPALFLYSTEKSLLDYEDNEDTIFRIVRTMDQHAK
jgi:hypothetical protein